MKQKTMTVEALQSQLIEQFGLQRNVWLMGVFKRSLPDTAVQVNEVCLVARGKSGAIYVYVVRSKGVVEMTQEMADSLVDVLTE